MSITSALKGLGGNAWDSPTPQSATAGSEQQLEIALVDPDPDQPRKQFDEDTLTELAESIRVHGLQQPIGVRPNPSRPGRYVLSFGERRWRACKILNLTTIPAVVREGGNSVAIALIENLQREDLTAWEIARALASYAESHNKKAAQIAADIGKAASYVTEHLALKRMPDDFQKALEAGTVNDIRTLNDAYSLYKEYPAEATKLVVGASLDSPLTRDQVRKVSKNLKGEDARPKGGKAKVATSPAENAEGADNTKDAGAASTVPAFPRIFVLDGDGNELGYLDLTRAAAGGRVFVIQNEQGLSTAETVVGLRLARVEHPPS